MRLILISSVQKLRAFVEFLLWGIFFFFCFLCKVHSRVFFILEEWLAASSEPLAFTLVQYSLMADLDTDIPCPW